MTAQEAAGQLAMAEMHLGAIHDAVEHLRGTPVYAAGVSTYLELLGEHRFLEGALLGASPSDFQALGRHDGFAYSFLLAGGAALAIIGAALGGMIGKHLGESDAAEKYYTCLDRQYDAGMSLDDAAKVCGLPIMRTGILESISGIVKWGTFLVAAIGGLYIIREIFDQHVTEAPA